MDACPDEAIHDQATRRSHLTYCFTAKHHGAGLKSDSRWSPALSRQEEFAVFDMADENQLSDADGNLYGLRIAGLGEQRRILALGSRNELIARFWAEDAEAPWHGHPLWPVITRDSLNRKKQGNAPPKAVFDRMVEANVLTEVQAARIRTARHIGNL